MADELFGELAQNSANNLTEGIRLNDAFFVSGEFRQELRLEK
jgi:hypothetical protein